MCLCMCECIGLCQGQRRRKAELCAAVRTRYETCTLATCLLQEIIAIVCCWLKIILKHYTLIGAATALLSKAQCEGSQMYFT